MIVASHRGPVTFRATGEGAFVATRGAGGVVSALTPLLRGRTGDRWIAAALTDDDRGAVRARAVPDADLDVRLLDLDPVAHRLHYDVVSNGTLWFLFHGLFDLPRRPLFGARFREAWEGYAAVNRAFADAIAQDAADDDVVLVQDYQLALVPGFVRSLRPDLRVVQFLHTPFCGPNSIRVLPDMAAEELCSSLATGPTGFHSERWAAAYRASVQEVLGGAPPPTFAASFGPDPAELRATAESETARAAEARLDALVGDRAVIYRTERLELSKNIVRGFLAFDSLLESHAEWRERVCFVAYLYASREALPEYLAYRLEVERTVARINERWGTPHWRPVVLDTNDDFARSVAGFTRADVLLVNPIRDGLNLVALEGPILSRRDAVLCLAREAGAWDQLGEPALRVHPYDIEQTAAALERALSMPTAERARRAARLRELAVASSAEHWLAAQLEEAARVGR